MIIRFPRSTGRLGLVVLALVPDLVFEFFPFVINKNIVQPKQKNIFNYVKFATCLGYSNHHQADISVHGHDMFSATVWDLTFQYMDMTCSVPRYGISYCPCTEMSA